MSLGLIWAQGHDRVIGRDGAMPWHLPEDMAHFRDTTIGHAVIIGRATWDGLPPRFRPLPGRDNYVMTRDEAWHNDGAERISRENVAKLAREMDVWIIGGGQMYALFIDEADRLEVTEIDKAFDADTYAPAVPADFRANDAPWMESEVGLRYRFMTYTRG